MARPVGLRSLIIGFLAGVLVAWMAFRFWSQPVVAPSAEALSVYTKWLANTCAIRQQSQLESSLQKFGSQLEAPLIDLFQNGPPASEIQRVKDAAQRELEHTRALVKSGSVTGLPANDVEALRKASVDDWVKRAEEDFVSSRKENALAGIGIIGGSKGRRLLEQVVNDGSEFSEVARQVLYGDPPPAARVAPRQK